MNEYIKKNILQVNKLHQNRSRRYLSASTWIHVPTFAVETCLIIVVMHIVVAQTVETLEIVLSVGLYCQEARYIVLKVETHDLNVVHRNHGDCLCASMRT